MLAWNSWYHAMANTYGTWLPGDPRGFRTRHHREHVDGDYHRPPTTDYAARHQHARGLMQREPVILSPVARRVAVEELVLTLQRHEIEVVAASMSGMHMHVLARFPMKPMKPTFRERGLERTSAVDDPVRHHIGIAKQWSAKRLIREHGFTPGGVWAKRGKIVPIADRVHQVNVFNYIRDHVNEGAWVWTLPRGYEARGEEAHVP